MIKVNPVTSLNLFSVKKNFETIGREAWSLQKPTDSTFVDTAPGTDDLEEGQAVFYVNGATYKIYFKINGAIKSVAIT